MSSRTLTSVVTIALLTVTLPGTAAASAQVQAQEQAQAKPEPKTDDKAGAAFAGKWNVTVQGPNGAVESTLDLKVDGKKVTGGIASQMGEAKIEGEIADGKLTFWFSMDMSGQSLNVTFVGTSQKDNSLAGTLNFGQGEMTWTAVRAKN